MTLEPGATLGHYQILDPLGAGGMGEVYRAADRNLGREVAIKVLPPEVAEDPERLARFRREAHLLASLNHPNIAAIHGLEEAGGRPFLTLELVEGEDLQQRLARGRLPADEALPVAAQIAAALEEAHERGVVHRDLKPANIKLRADGQAKVLDFGLAKARSGDEGRGSAPDLSQSPTLAHTGTQAGVLLGTAAYMAPEQARGREADRRADIWAFGVVLWEMLTGRRLFEGETVSDVLAAVLRAEPDLTALPPDTPPAVRDLVRRCLERDPKRRLQWIGDARVVIEDALDEPGAAPGSLPGRETAGATTPRWRRLVPWALAGVMAAVAALALRPEPVATGAVVTAVIPPPDDTAFDLRERGPASATLSPDGRLVTFGAMGPDETTRLYVRELGSGRVRGLPGTEGAQYPFWSPDSRWIAFFTQADETLKKVAADGGAPLTVCRARNGKGGSWGPGDVILLAPGSGTTIFRVPAAGGEPVAVTRLDPERSNSHRHPRLLPGGRHFLYFARAPRLEASELRVASLDGETTRVLLTTRSQAELASGHLLFVRERTLMAQPFDLDGLELSGQAVALQQDVAFESGAAFALFSSSQTGLLVYHTGQSQAEIAVEWRDREGRVVGTVGPPGEHRHVTPSPDGKLVAMSTSRSSGDVGVTDIWIEDLRQGVRSRLTLDPGEDIYGTWTPDSRSLIFSSNRNGPHDLFRKAVGGGGDVELLFGSGGRSIAQGVSPDGRVLLYAGSGDGQREDLWALDLESGEARAFLQGPASEREGQFSPDGKWVAYSSDESGSREIYVTPFPGPGRRWQVSAAGGMYPWWRGDGREIVYSDLAGRVTAVSVVAEGESFRVGSATPLFQIAPPEPDTWRFAPDAQADRFLVTRTGVGEAKNTLHLVVNWPGELEEP